MLIAMTFKPCRSEVIDAVRIAREQRVTVIGVSDSAASPVILTADTPQFFHSSVSTIAFLETLLGIVISVASDEIAEPVDGFHCRRHQLGMYQEDPS